MGRPSSQAGVAELAKEAARDHTIPIHREMSEVSVKSVHQLLHTQPLHMQREYWGVFV
jgi:hypothetical protein